MPQLTSKESIKKIKYSVEGIRYNYLHTDGALFQCTKSAIEDCRFARNHWIEQGYLLGERQMVYDIQSRGRYLVFNPQLKGYVILIEIETAQIICIRRNLFFHTFNLFGTENESEKLDDKEVYTFMLKAYHLQFSKKK